MCITNNNNHKTKNMNLTQSQIKQCNVEIVRFTVVPSTEKIGCECLIAEQEEYNTVVTYDELREMLRADKYDIIEVWVGDEEVKVPFSAWLNAQINGGDLREYLENYINNREKRKPLHQVVTSDPFADIADMIDGMI